MFSGIVEAVMPLVKAEKSEHLIRIWVSCPSDFNDLKIGDSIAVNGVCLTVEAFDNSTIQFALGFETLKILQKAEISDWLNEKVNLERSLRFGDRIHGHLVSGHVEGVGQILSLNSLGECLTIQFKIPANVVKYCFKKGSISLNGVSLTLNEVTVHPANEVYAIAEVCLIPETLKKTNLGLLKVGDMINLEPDYYVKTLLHLD
jgi:riboflavin synthase